MYRLIIPSTQLFVLNRFNPDLSLQLFEGFYHTGEQVSTQEFKYGKVTDYSRRKLDLKYIMDSGEATINDIYRACIDRGFPDASLDCISYMTPLPKIGNVRIDFEKDTISTTKMQNMVQDGRYPMDDIKEILDNIKLRLKDLPREVTKRFRNSFLLSTQTVPDITIKAESMKLLRKDYMMMIEETQGAWILKDMKVV